VRAGNPPCSLNEGGCLARLDAKRLDSGARRDDVRDRIGRSDLVKADIVRRDVMDFSLRLSDPFEDCQRAVFDRRRERRFCDQLTDLAVISPVSVVTVPALGMVRVV
jgi:hypothetical protein